MIDLGAQMVDQIFKHLVIVLPGISGSVLSRDGVEIWGTSTGAIWRAVTSGGRSVRDLALKGVDDPTLDDLGDGVTATRLVQDLHILPGLWKIDGYTGLVERLKTSLALEAGRNLFEFPYDWRRDNRVAARKLARSARTWLDRWRQDSGAADAKLVLVAHSMGGLVSQYFLEVMGGWKDTRALISFGTPYRGSLNALGYLANGYSEGVGPLKVDLTSTLASFTAIYQLLPAFACVDRGTGKRERIGEIDGITGVDAARAKAALDFYDEIKAAADVNTKDDAYKTSGFETYPIVGLAQPTFQSATAAGGKVTLLRSFDGKDNSGDGTVPRVSATPLALSSAHREIYVVEQHGSLQNFEPALVNLTGVLTGMELDLSTFFAPQETLSLDIDDVYCSDDVVLRAIPSAETAVSARIENAETNAFVQELALTEEGDAFVARMPLPPGAYRVRVTADFPTNPVTVTETFLTLS
jgi:pimeloyl-ACP methyl ester carboxylesterase